VDGLNACQVPQVYFVRAHISHGLVRSDLREAGYMKEGFQPGCATEAQGRRMHYMSAGAARALHAATER